MTNVTGPSYAKGHSALRAERPGPDSGVMTTTERAPQRAEIQGARDGTRLEIAHLTKRYGKNVVVNDLTFDAEPGRVTGFLGPNGSGKSTTMKILLDLA